MCKRCDNEAAGIVSFADIHSFLLWKMWAVVQRKNGAAVLRSPGDDGAQVDIVLYEDEAITDAVRRKADALRPLAQIAGHDDICAVAREIASYTRVSASRTMLMTPELYGQMDKAIQLRQLYAETVFPGLVSGLPVETRLAAVCWVFEHLCDHAEIGGTFRHLLYDRMGFGHDAYLHAYSAGGMDISNWLFDACDKDGELTRLREENAELRQAAGEKPDTLNGAAYV